MNEYKVKLEDGSTFYDIVDSGNNKMYWFENERLARQICVQMNENLTLTKQNEILKSMLELIEENDFSESHICCAGYSELKAVAKSTRNSLQALKEIEKLDEK